MSRQEVSPSDTVVDAEYLAILEHLRDVALNDMAPAKDAISRATMLYCLSQHATAAGALASIVDAFLGRPF